MIQRGLERYHTYEGLVVTVSLERFAILGDLGSESVGMFLTGAGATPLAGGDLKRRWELHLRGILTRASAGAADVRRLPSSLPSQAGSAAAKARL